MTYKLTYNRAYYGNRSVPFTLLEDSGIPDIGIPREIESVDDLDENAIAREINQTVFNKGTPKSWEMEIHELTPAKAAALTKEMEAAGMVLKQPVTPSISIICNGVTIRYEMVSP